MSKTNCTRLKAVKILTRGRTIFRINKRPKKKKNHVDERMHITRVGDAVLMKTKRARYASYERSVEYRGSREWNNLDVTVRNCTFATEFKSIQKHWLLNSIN